MPECACVLIAVIVCVERKNKRIEELSNKFFTKMLTGKLICTSNWMEHVTLIARIDRLLTFVFAMNGDRTEE